MNRLRIEAQWTRERSNLLTNQITWTLSINEYGELSEDEAYLIGYAIREGLTANGIDARLVTTQEVTLP